MLCYDARTAVALNLDTALKIGGIAVAVGLDVLALSIAIGIMQKDWRVRARMAVAFSVSEVIMQVVGYLGGAAFGHVVGGVADYIGFAVLALVGVWIVRESFQDEGDPKTHPQAGWGFVAVCLSVSLDSLGIGVSLPGVPLPLLPLLGTVAASTALFTTVGLAFGGLLGARYEKLAERGAGLVLIFLAIVFTAQHVAGRTP